MEYGCYGLSRQAMKEKNRDSTDGMSSKPHVSMKCKLIPVLFYLLQETYAESLLLDLLLLAIRCPLVPLQFHSSLSPVLLPTSPLLSTWKHYPTFWPPFNYFQDKQKHYTYSIELIGALSYGMEVGLFPEWWVSSMPIRNSVSVRCRHLPDTNTEDTMDWNVDMEGRNNSLLHSYFVLQTSSIIFLMNTSLGWISVSLTTSPFHCKWSESPKIERMKMMMEDWRSIITN